jgi:hypothetical protein
MNGCKQTKHLVTCIVAERLPSPKTAGEVDSISNFHASRTLPLPLRPGSQNGRRLAFVFILNYRLDCGSANSACRVRPTLAAHRPQTKTCPRKERRGSQTRGLHIPDLRGAQQQELQVRPPERIKGAGGSSIASPSHLHLSRHLVFAIPRGTLLSTSDTHSVSFCLTATSRTKARPIPRGHAVSQPSPLNSNLLYRLNY